MSQSIKRVPCEGVYGSVWTEGGGAEWLFESTCDFISKHRREDSLALDHFVQTAAIMSVQKKNHYAKHGEGIDMTDWVESPGGLSYEIYLDPRNAVLFVLIKAFTDEQAQLLNQTNHTQTMMFGLDEIDGKISHVGTGDMISRGEASAPSNRKLVPPSYK